LEVSSASDGATVELAAGTHAWSHEVMCSKTTTVTGAGKAVTVLDAGSERRFFTLQSGCTLTLKHLSLHNGASDQGGAIYESYGSSSTLYATDVEFKDNSASSWVRTRAAPAPPHCPRPQWRTSLTPPRPHASSSPPPTRSLARLPHTPGRRGVRHHRRQRHLYEL
jgi:hypothetical protein